MKRGKISIEQNIESGNISVQIELVDNTVWLTKSEIARLFDVFSSSVRANLKIIFANKELFETEVIRYETYKDNEGLSNTTEFYNLDVVIALSFRLKGGYARSFREWVRKQITKSIVNSNKVPIIIQLSSNQISN